MPRRALDPLVALGRPWCPQSRTCPLDLVSCEKGLRRCKLRHDLPCKWCGSWRPLKQSTISNEAGGGERCAEVELTFGKRADEHDEDSGPQEPVAWRDVTLRIFKGHLCVI